MDVLCIPLFLSVSDDILCIYFSVYMFSISHAILFITFPVYVLSVCGNVLVISFPEFSSISATDPNLYYSGQTTAILR